MLIYVFILWFIGILFVAGNPFTIHLNFRSKIPNRTTISPTLLKKIQETEYSDLFFIPKLRILSEGTICITTGSLLTVTKRVGFVKDQKGDIYEIYHLSKTYIDHFKEASLKLIYLSKTLFSNDIIAFYDEETKDWRIMKLEEAKNICGDQFDENIIFRPSMMIVSFGFPSKSHNIILDSYTSRLIFVPQGDNLERYATIPIELSIRMRALLALNKFQSESQIQKGNQLNHSIEKFTLSEINNKMVEYLEKRPQLDIPISFCQVGINQDEHQSFVPNIENFSFNLPTTLRDPAISIQQQPELNTDQINQQPELNTDQINEWIEDLDNPKPLKRMCRESLSNKNKDG